MDVVENDEATRRRIQADADQDRAKTTAPDAPKVSEADKPPLPTRRRRSIALPIVLLLIFVAAIGGGYYWYSTRDQESTDDAYTDGRAITVSPKVTGYVVELRVNDNQRVKAGDVLFRIGDKDYVTARDQAAGALALAQAQLDNSRIALEAARVTYPARLASAQAQLASAKATQIRAQNDYRRQRSVDRAATTQENVDAASASLQQAAAQVLQAEAQVKEADLVAQNVAQAEAQVRQLQGQVAQAAAQLAQAEINLGYCIIRAPQDGWVTKRNVERGNLVQPGQSLLSLVSPEVWITANFKENQLDRMRPGQHVDIAIDAYPSLHLSGHVDSIQLGSGARFTAFPPENATGNFVKIVQRVPVKIVIDQGLDASLPLPLSLSAVPTVYLK